MFVYTFRGFRSFLEELLLKPFLTRELRVLIRNELPRGGCDMSDVSLRRRHFRN